MPSSNEDHSLVYRVLEELGQPRARPVRLREGVANDVYRIGRELVIRVGVGSDAAGFATAAEILLAVSGQVRAPRLLMFEEKRFDHPVMVCEYVTGQPLSRTWSNLDAGGQQNVMEQVLDEFGSLHAFPAGALKLPGDWPTRQTAEIDRLLALPAQVGTERLVSEVADFRVQLSPERFPAPSLCLVHGDFNAGNVIFDQGRLQAIIDFDDACLAPREIEYWCMLDVLTEPPFGLSLADAKRWIAPNYSFANPATRTEVAGGSTDTRAAVVARRQANEIDWLLRCLLEPPTWLETEDPLEQAWRDWRGLIINESHINALFG